MLLSVVQGVSFTSCAQQTQPTQCDGEAIVNSLSKLADDNLPSMLLKYDVISNSYFEKQAKAMGKAVSDLTDQDKSEIINEASLTEILKALQPMLINTLGGISQREFVDKYFPGNDVKKFDYLITEDTMSFFTLVGICDTFSKDKIPSSKGNVANPLTSVQRQQLADWYELLMPIASKAVAGEDLIKKYADKFYDDFDNTYKEAPLFSLENFDYKISDDDTVIIESMYDGYNAQLRASGISEDVVTIDSLPKIIYYFFGAGQQILTAGKYYKLLNDAGVKVDYVIEKGDLFGFQDEFFYDVTEDITPANYNTVLLNAGFGALGMTDENGNVDWELVFTGLLELGPEDRNEYIEGYFKSLFEMTVLNAYLYPDSEFTYTMHYDGNVPKLTGIYYVDKNVLMNERIFGIPTTQIAELFTEAIEKFVATPELRNAEKHDNNGQILGTGLNNIFVALPHIIDIEENILADKFGVDKDAWTYCYDGKLAPSGEYNDIKNTELETIKSYAINPSSSSKYELADYIYDIVVNEWCYKSVDVYDLYVIENGITTDELYINNIVNRGVNIFDKDNGMVQKDIVFMKSLKHSFSEYVSDNNATCTEDGTKTATCSRCGEKITLKDSGSAIGHNEVNDEAVEPTCTQTGLTEGIHCSVCGAVIHEQEEVDALGHNAILVNEKTASCTEQGYTGDTVCSVCDTMISAGEATNKAEHAYEATVVAPSCTEKGYTTYTCTACGDSFIDNYVNEAAHKPVSTVTKATLSANGKVVTSCSACNEVISTTVIAKPATIKLSAVSYVYNGKAKKPAVSVVDSDGKSLVQGTDYTVSYASGCKNVGRYKVTVTFKGSYNGSQDLYFTIVPKATSISKVTAGKKAFTVKWKKQAKQTTGYQIEYSTNSSFTKSKKVTIKKNTTTSKKITKLSGKKKYYVRVRTYKTVKVNGKSTKLYSAWSKTKTVKTK